MVINMRRPIMDCCDHCHAPDPHRENVAYGRVLWAVLSINAANVSDRD
jgi:hypothetical protein